MFFYSGQKPKYEDYFPGENGMFWCIEGLHFPNEWQIYSYLFERRFFLMDMISILSLRNSRMILSFDKFAKTCSSLALVNRQSAKFFQKLIENAYYKTLKNLVVWYIPQIVPKKPIAYLFENPSVSNVDRS